MFWNYFNIQDFEDIYHTIIQYSESSSNRNKLHKGYVWPKRKRAAALGFSAFPCQFPDSMYAVYVFWFKHVHMTFVSLLRWCEMSCWNCKAWSSTSLLTTCVHAVSFSSRPRIYFFGKSLNHTYSDSSFFTYTSTDTQYLSSKFLRSLGLLDSRFYGMWDVASLGAGVSAG